jgi:cyclopropane-fatty-acyl-phospholipid synthase
MNSKTQTVEVTGQPCAESSPSLFRRAVFASFSAMTRGSMTIELPDGSKHQFGATRETLPLGIKGEAKIRVLRESFFQKIVLAGDIGFAESHIDGDWTSPDLAAVVSWFIVNISTAPTLSGSKRAQGMVLNLLRMTNRVGQRLRRNSPANAKRNISEHYDLSNEFFALFLDRSLMYSAAKFTRPEMSLEEAQFEKNDALCRKLQLKPTDQVLEVGTGWGGWALHAAQRYGCRITTVTISRQQFELATKRVREAGLESRVEVRFQDFREITGQFDKIVSIEMMEALGHEYLEAFAEALNRALKPEGLLALQFITCPDNRYAEFRKGVDFIQKHIFPGSLLLSVNRVNDLFAAKGGFVLHALDDFGPDYAITLRKWAEAFSERLAEVRALGFDERFIRKWTYYLKYCEAAFALRNISVVHTLHTRANNLSL